MYEARRPGSLAFVDIKVAESEQSPLFERRYDGHVAGWLLHQLETKRVGCALTQP